MFPGKFWNMFPKFGEHLGNTECSPSSPKIFGEQEHYSHVPHMLFGEHFGEHGNIWETCALRILGKKLK